MVFAVVLACAAPPRARAEGTRDDVTAISARLKNGEPVVFATVGDSITYACFHTDYRQNYITFTVDALRQAYPRAKIRIVHAGNLGTAARGLADSRFERYVLKYDPDMVFIMFGMNDCGSRSAGLDGYDRNLTELIRKTRESGAVPVICTQNEILYHTTDGRRRTALPMYMARSLEVSRRENVAAVDCFADWQGLKDDPQQLILRLNDAIHPNHAGHRLFARSIVDSLWPEAASYVDTAVATPEKPDAGTPVAGLLPGPAGRHVLRTEDGTWYALIGRNVEGRIRDLVLSRSFAEQPRWSDFEHLTLIGSPQHAVFDHMDRTLTSGMLIERDGRIHILFGWRVGVFMLTIKHERPANDAEHSRLEQAWQDPYTWLEHIDEPYVRPTNIISAHMRPHGILYDAFVQENGWPQVLCLYVKRGPGAGNEVIRGDDMIAMATRTATVDSLSFKFVAPPSALARFVEAADGRRDLVVQPRSPGPIQWGPPGVGPSDTTEETYDRVIVSAIGRHRLAVARQLPRSPMEAPQWVQLNRGDAGTIQVSPLPVPDKPGTWIPLPWSDGQREGICWHPMAEAGNTPRGLAFSSVIARGQSQMGIVTNFDGHMEFHMLRCEP